MIRKLITLLVLIGLVYMGYRIIDPIGAQALLVRVQSWFADDVEPVLLTQDPIDVAVSTGVTSHTGAVDTGAEQIVIIPTSTDVQVYTGNVTTGQSVATQIIPIKPTTSITTTPKTQNKSALSDQDMKDLQHLLNAIVE